MTAQDNKPGYLYVKGLAVGGFSAEERRSLHRQTAKDCINHRKEVGPLEAKEDTCPCVEAEEARIKQILLMVLPECFVCHVCGPFVKADEDGCCTMCGADAQIRRRVK
mgnify:CR=1 FL=1